MSDSPYKQILTRVVATVLAGLILWKVEALLDHRTKEVPVPAVPPTSVPGAVKANPLEAQAVWFGFANETSPPDRETELRRRCGDFRRVYVPVDAGNRFTELCAKEGKTCDRVCDWEGRIFPCSAVSLGGRRDATRIALCR